MKIRVLRIIEYIYSDVRTMQEDMAHWQVQGTYMPNNRMTVKSVAMPMELLEELGDEASSHD